MDKLDKKYVFHIPFFKYENEKLVPLDIENIVDDFLKQLNENGYDSLYMKNVKAMYKSRCFDELLIILFVSSLENRESPINIFKQWFNRNNKLLKQESFSYEYGNVMFVEKL